jgi:(1->4)-alpha-D-glucan 1-alpha-D-glucosylmutase
MSSTATHDTKRGEEFRARLHVLSEAADEWKQVFTRWRRMNEPLRDEIDGESVPDANEAYLLYQTLVGTWPIEPMQPAEQEHYRDRIAQYMEKALREAKIHTSWMNPSESYDGAVRKFVSELLSKPESAFISELTDFVHQIADAGFVNSLAQLVLKSTVPGVPDFYQGTELWDFNLVDPDNRRPVDFAEREQRLKKLLAVADTDLEAAAAQIAQRWPDGDVKLWITTRCLNSRRDWPDVFSFGEYIPLMASGSAADHVIGFARRCEEKCVIAVVPRHVYRLCGGNVTESLRGKDTWRDTRLVLPPDFATNWRCCLSGRVFGAMNSGGEVTLDVADLFRVVPVALLTCE